MEMVRTPSPWLCLGCQSFTRTTQRCMYMITDDGCPCYECIVKVTCQNKYGCAEWKKMRDEFHNNHPDYGRFVKEYGESL